MSSYSILLRERAPKLIKELSSRHLGNKVTVKVCQKFLTRMDELAALDAHIGSVRDRVPKDILNMITGKLPDARSLLTNQTDCSKLAQFSGRCLKETVESFLCRKIAST